MTGRSTVARLPTDVLDELHAQLNDGRLTIDDLTAFLHARGAEVSRSAVGRYAKGYAAKTKRINEVREMVGGMMTDLKQDPEGKVARGLVQFVETAAVLTAADVAEDEDPVSRSPKELKFLADTSLALARARAVSQETEKKIRAQMAQEAVAAVDKVVADRGFGADTIDEIKRAVLGIR